VRACRA